LGESSRGSVRLAARSTLRQEFERNGWKRDPSGRSIVSGRLELSPDLEGAIP
jgi:hypothetical protein